MLIDGRIDACFSYGTFFPVQTLADRSISTDVWKHPTVKPLFDDVKKAQVEYYRKTGIQPINHMIIIKSKILEEHPWVAMNIFKAFQKSKEICYQRAREVAYTPNSYVWLGQLYEEVQTLFGGDPFPYGIQRNLKTLETVVEYSHEQGFISEKMAPASLFYESTRSL
jgi:4,5-dihydroxyphthalate decarboxylase